MFRSDQQKKAKYENTYYPTLYFPFPGMVGVSVEELSGFGSGLMSPPPARCGCSTDHWPALKEQKVTTTKVSARSRYFARGLFLPDLGLGELSSSRGSSDVESLSYRKSGMAERGQAFRTRDRPQNPLYRGFECTYLSISVQGKLEKYQKGFRWGEPIQLLGLNPNQ